MNVIILKIIPIVLIFVLGFFLKSINVLKKESADWFIKLAFYVAIPALIITALTGVDLSAEFIYFPIIATLIILAGFGMAFLTGRLLKLKRQTFGTFVCGTMIMNTGFTYPFFIAVFGAEGFARMVIFDIANGILLFTFAYYIACRYGKNSKGAKTAVKKLVLSPPIWAFVIGIILNLSGVTMPVIAGELFRILGNLFIPLLLLSLGIYFTPKIVKLIPLSSAILIRMGFGLLLGFLFVKLFNIEGLNRIVVMVGASAPISYNSLTFSSLENLDKEFAASMISISILIGMFLIPILMYLLS
jgi:predicted permease